MILRWFHQFHARGRAFWSIGAASLASFGCAGAASTPPVTPALTTPGNVPERPPAEPLPADIVARSALPMHALVGAERLTEPELWERMSTFKVVCLGERHDSPAHHFAQRRSIEELGRRSAANQRPLALGFEMFQLPYQAALTAFVSGGAPEARFLVDSQYRERWGFDFALYRPLLEAARELGLPALALNAPRELTRKIGRSGLRALDADEQKQLPELDLGNAEHRAYFTRAMEGHPMTEGAPLLDDMYAVQVVWDETMADTGARWLEAAPPSAQLVVFAGSGHCHQTAIPARVSRRIHAPALSVSAVLESQLAELEARERYDWLLVLEDGAR